MLTQYNTTFAKLLATENIDVQFGDFKSPFFCVKDRILGIPSWTWSVPNSQPLWYLEVGHEVGHAKYTPFEEWEATLKEIEDTPVGEIVITKDLVNIIEDVRIERLMKKRFPGLEKYFGLGYKRMLEEDVDYFGLKGKTSFSLKDATFLDRVNLKAKCGDLLDVEFTDEEQAFFDAAFETETFADVISLSYEIAEFIRNQKQEAQKEASGNVANPEDQSGDEETGEQTAAPEEQSDETAEGGSSADGEDQAEDDEGTTSTGEGDEEEGKPTAYGHEGDNSDATDELTSKTQREYENKRSEAVETDRYGDVKLTGQPMSDELRDHIIEPLTVPDVSFYYKEQYNEFVKRNKSTINSMVREFEIRKKAAQYRNAKVVRTGTLDMKKLHEYRYNDEIFVRGMKIPGGKSHGMVMLIDFSGSMYDVIGRVIKQTLLLALFCRKANIPFVVYGFTCNGRYSPGRKDMRGQLDAATTEVRELLNSDLSNSDFNACAARMARGEYPMGGTPLNESLIAIQPIVKNFKETKKLQRMNLVVLTDGSANKMGVHGSSINRYSEDQSIMLDKRTKMVIPAKDYTTNEGDCEATKDILDWYRATGAADTITHYFLMDKTMCNYAGIRNSAKSQPVIKSNMGGYDVKFLIPVKSKALSSQTEALDIEEDAKKGAVIRAFKKHAGSKRNNRVIVQKFAEIIS